MLIANKKKTVILTAALAFIFFVFNFYADNSRASVADNTGGYAWSDNIGWISFNCTDNSCASTNYGVNLDFASGNLSGYAWSDTVGWISFDSADLAGCPVNTARGDCLPYYDSGTNELHGWARATSACKDDLWNGANCTGSGAGNKAGGWGGWISLNCAEGEAGGICASSDYKVSLNGTDFSGFAYGGMVVGWISFNCLDSAVCGTSDYKVHIAGNPPVVSDLGTNKDSINYCADSPLSINLSWRFNDTEDGFTQTAYKLKIVRSDGAVYDPGVITSSNTWVNGLYINSIIPGFIRYNLGGETYSWEVTAYDSSGLSDGPELGSNFDFPLHKYPDVDFGPPPPYLLMANTLINFEDFSVAYGGAMIKKWEWDFGDGEPGSTVTIKRPPKTSGNYDYTYTVNSDSYTVKLKVTDSSGYSCQTSKEVKVPLPQWREVVPMDP